MELIYFSCELRFLSHWILFSYVVPFYHMCLEYSMILLFRILPLLESLPLLKKFPYISLQTLMTNSSILLTVCQMIFNIFPNAIMSCVCIINWHHSKFAFCAICSWCIFQRHRCVQKSASSTLIYTIGKIVVNYVIFAIKCLLFTVFYIKISSLSNRHITY